MTTLRRWPERAAGAARGLPANLRLFAGAMRLLFGAEPRVSGAYLALVLGSSVLAVAQVWLGKVVVDGLAAGGVGAADWAAVVRAALWPAGLYALVMVLLEAGWPAQLALANRIQERAAAEIDRRLIGAGARLVDLGRVERPLFQDQVRLVQETHLVPRRLLEFVRGGAGNALTLLGVLALLAQLQPLLPLALVLLGVPQIGVAQRLTELAFTAMVQRSRAAREMDYCARLTTEPGAAKELRVFGLGGFFLQRFEARQDAALRDLTGVRFRELRAFVLLGGLQALAFAAGFWYVAAQAAAGRLTLGDIALYLAAGARVTDLTFAESFRSLSEALLQCRAFFSITGEAAPTVALPPPGATADTAPPAALRQGLSLRGVRFRYPEGAADALAGATADLPAGKVTALVGANGAGKTTLVKLLTRMYDPTAGEILWDGTPLSQYDLEALRARIAVVHQDFARFAFTFRENVAAGAVALTPPATDDQIGRAVRRAGAEGVLAALPRGYDTDLTRRFEGGVDLSGGEWQAVALARAFVRDAALVILDEPTAALDAAAEAHLFARFRELVAGKTALLISHRFSTVRMADHILVLAGGRIAEAGSHAELVAAGGRYAALYELQARHYRDPPPAPTAPVPPPGPHE